MKKGTKLPNGYVLGKGRTPLNLTESQIRYAMKNSKSNSGAARFLNVSLTTYQKYSKLYKDEETAERLFAENLLREERAQLDIKKILLKSFFSSIF